MIAVRFGRLLTREYGLLFIAGLFLGAIAAVPLGHLEIERELLDDPAAPNQLSSDYQQFQKSFGSDEAMVFAYSVEAYDRPETLRALLALNESLESLPVLEAVYDPLLYYQSRYGTSAPPRAKHVRETLAHLAGDKVFSDWIISRDGRTAGLVLILSPDASWAEQKDIFDRVTAAFEQAGIAFSPAGPFFFEESVLRDFESDLRQGLPVLLAVLLVMMIISLRNGRLVASILVGVLINLACVLALFPAMGVKLNLTLMFLFPLLFCLGVSGSIYLYVRVGQQGEVDRVGFRRAFVEVLPPATAAAGALALAGSALVFSSEPMIRILGLTAGAGICLTYLFTFFFIPSLYALLSGGFHFKGVAWAGYREKVFSRRKAGLWIIVLVFLAGLSATRLPNLEMNTHLIHFFKGDSKLARAYNNVENHLTGMLVLEMVLRSGDGRPIDDPERLRAMAAFLEDLKRNPGLKKVHSILNATTGQMALAFQESFLSTDFTETRVQLRYQSGKVADDDRLKKEIRRSWEAFEPEGVSMQITGRAAVAAATKRHFLGNQLGILGLSGLILVLYVLCVFRSGTFFVMAILALVLPVLYTAGFMEAMNFKINRVNVLTLAVLGALSVSGVFYLLYSLQRRGAMRATIEETGPALGWSVLSVSVSFMALAGSRFLPVAEFGILASTAAAGVYLCNRYLLPAGVYLSGRFTVEKPPMVIPEKKKRGRYR